MFLCSGFNVQFIFHVQGSFLISSRETTHGTRSIGLQRKLESKMVLKAKLAENLMAEEETQMNN